MRLASQGAVRHAAEAFAIQETIDPIDLAAGCLLDDAERASCVVGGGLVNDTELHGRAASSRDWNWCASPPWTKKLFGSWASGSEGRRGGLELVRIAALDKEAVWIVALGQRGPASGYASFKETS